MHEDIIRAVPTGHLGGGPPHDALRRFAPEDDSAVDVRDIGPAWKGIQDGGSMSFAQERHRGFVQDINLAPGFHCLDGCEDHGDTADVVTGVCVGALALLDAPHELIENIILCAQGWWRVGNDLNLLNLVKIRHLVNPDFAVHVRNGSLFAFNLPVAVPVAE